MLLIRDKVRRKQTDVIQINYYANMVVVFDITKYF